jgi:hypothetical protein
MSDIVTDQYTGETATVYTEYTEPGFLLVDSNSRGNRCIYCIKHKRIFGLYETCKDCEQP